MMIPRDGWLGWLDRVVELNFRVTAHEVSQRTVENMKWFARFLQLVVFLHSKPLIIQMVVLNFSLFVHCC